MLDLLVEAELDLVPIELVLVLGILLRVSTLLAY